MKRPFLVIGLVLLIFASVAFAQTGKTPEATSGTSQAQTCTPSMCDIVGSILNEVQILNNNKPGEIVTGTAVLKDGQPGATGFWQDMPTGTCDVNLFSEAGGLNHASGNYSWSMAEVGATGNRKSYFCSSNGNSWTDCTVTMTFDDQFHFLHTNGPGDVIYLQVSYKCTLA